MPGEESQADEGQRRQPEGGLGSGGSDKVAQTSTARTWHRPSRKATVITGAIVVSVLVLSAIWTLSGISVRDPGASGEGARFEIFIPGGSYRLTSDHSDGIPWRP